MRGVARNATTLFCHHAKRGGRKHTGKKRKLEIAEGVVNILQCNVTNWSENAKHYILTSDFDAALISEAHLEREKVVTAAQRCAKNSRGQAQAVRRSALQAMAQVREYSHWSALVGFSTPLSVCTDEAGVLCPNPRLAGRVVRVKGRRFLMFTAYFQHFVAFRSDINANLMQDVCFLTRDGKLPFILGAPFNFPPSLWQDLSMHGGSFCKRKLGASVVIPEGTTHTCRTGKSQNPDIIDYFLVSTLIRPLIRKCEIVMSVPCGPHHGVKLVLDINFGSVVSRQLTGKISKRSSHNTNALQGQSTHHTEEADPALWSERHRSKTSWQIEVQVLHDPEGLFPTHWFTPQSFLYPYIQIRKKLMPYFSNFQRKPLVVHLEQVDLQKKKKFPDVPYKFRVSG